MRTLAGGGCTLGGTKLIGDATGVAAPGALGIGDLDHGARHTVQGVEAHGEVDGPVTRPRRYSMEPSARSILKA